MSIAAVTRELLVRYLDTWAPGSVRATHGATFLQASGTPLDEDIAEAALRTLAEFADRLNGRRLSLLFVAPGAETLGGRLQELQRDLRTPPELTVHVVPGTAVGAVLKAAGAGAGPLLAMIDDTVAKELKAKPAEVLLTAPTGTWSAQREQLAGGGFELTAGVELVDGPDELLIGFGTRSAKSLEAFKTEMWALDEYAGVRYRDPSDPEGHLMDISLEPNPGALRRELLETLRDGPRTVTELRHFALTRTVYRSTDALKVIMALLHAGLVTRTPEAGRLGGDVTVTLR